MTPGERRRKKAWRKRKLGTRLRAMRALNPDGGPALLVETVRGDWVVLLQNGSGLTFDSERLARRYAEDGGFDVTLLDRMRFV